jgi:hypothetical protein
MAVSDWQWLMGFWGRYPTGFGPKNRHGDISFGRGGQLSRVLILGDLVKCRENRAGTT